MAEHSRLDASARWIRLRCSMLALSDKGFKKDEGFLAQRPNLVWRGQIWGFCEQAASYCVLNSSSVDSRSPLR